MSKIQCFKVKKGIKFKLTSEIRVNSSFSLLNSSICLQHNKTANNCQNIRHRTYTDPKQKIKAIH